jgi:hypothetical protein
LFDWSRRLPLVNDLERKEPDMVHALRHPALLIGESLRFAAVIGCATALIAAGRFLPL